MSALLTPPGPLGPADPAQGLERGADPGGETSRRRSTPAPGPERDWTTLRMAGAGLLATAAASLTLVPLLDGLGWMVPTLVAAVAVTLTGVALRQLISLWPVIAAVQAVVLVVVLTLLFARDQAVAGVLPGPRALGRLRDGLREGGELIGSSAPPVETAAGMVLLVALGIGVVALLVDLVAVTLHRPAAAGLALLAVYCVPAAVLADGIGWVYFLFAAIGYLLLISADGMDRLAAWGRVLGGPDGGRLRGGSPLQGGRRVALIALATAVLLPVVTPGMDQRLLGDGNGPGDGRGSGRINVINPILTLRQNLTARSDSTVITYNTSVSNPEPLRIATDDSFDGERWAPTTGAISRKQRVQDGLPGAPGLSAAVQVSEHQTSIAVGPLSQTYLPLPYPSTRVEIAGDWLYESNSLNVVGDGQRTENTSYIADHLVVSPTAEQLDAAPRAPVALREAFTALPSSLPREIRTIAAEVAGQGTDYARALALQDYLRNTGGFRYDEQVTGNAVDENGRTVDDSSDDAVLSFLKGKQGYCVQFASAMAVMARTLDIPARVAVGFLPGSKVDQGYEITLRDAHAWPELYFQGVGWTRFEPTPADRVAELPGYAQGEAENPAPQATPTASTAAAPSAQASASNRPEDAVDETSVDADTRPFWQKVPWRLLAALALLVLLAAVPMIASALARRRRWNRARSPLQVAEAAWDELRSGLGDLGVGWTRSWTPRAMSHRLSSDHPIGDDEQAALARLVGDVEGARYAPPGQGAARTAAQVRQDVAAVVTAVAGGREAKDRRRARFFPRSGFTALGAALSPPSRRDRDDQSDVEVESGSTGLVPTGITSTRSTSTGITSTRASDVRPGKDTGSGSNGSGSKSGSDRAGSNGAGSDTGSIGQPRTRAERRSNGDGRS